MNESTNKELERLLPKASLGYSVYMTSATFFDLLTSAKSWEEAVKEKTRTLKASESTQAVYSPKKDR